LHSWGFDSGSIALFVLVTGIWNVFMKLGLPVLSLGILAVRGELTAALVTASLIGVAILLVAIALFALMLWKKRFAFAIGERLGRVVSWLLRVVRRPPVTHWGDGAVRFRKQTIRL